MQRAGSPEWIPEEQGDFDASFLAPEFFNNPHRFYHRLRVREPVHWSEQLGAWVLTRYTDVVAVARDPERFSNRGRVATLLDQLPERTRKDAALVYDHFSAGLLHSDPPDHTRLRLLVNKVFARGAIERLRPYIEQTVDELLETAKVGGKMDLIHDLAFPLPLAVVSEMLGLPVADRAQFKRWCDAVINVLAPGVTPEGAAAAAQGLRALREFLAGLVDERRRMPGEDLISRLIAAKEEGDQLSEKELMGTCVTIMLASHETTTNLIGNGLLALLRHRKELERLRREPDLIGSAVEELLRYESPLDHFTRVAKGDVELDGKVIRKGQLVSLSLVAANRDPAQFSEPDLLDLGRRNNTHVSFGFGPHFCLGAPLARLEGQIAIGTVVQRFPRLEIDADSIEWREQLNLRAAKAIPVAVT